MSDDTSMSVAAASKHARENPQDATEAIQTLFDAVEAGGDDVGSAATGLCVAGRRAPEALDGWTANFERALKTADDSRARHNLAEAVNELLEHQAIPPGDAGPALTEATRIRDDEYWEDDSEYELLIIQEGLEGWTEVAEISEPVPAIVVERAIGLFNIADFNTLIPIIDVLHAAVESGSEKRELAFEGLVELTRVDHEPIKSEAIIVIAKLVLSDDMPDEAAAREVLTTNADAAQREQQLVEQAREDISV